MVKTVYVHFGQASQTASKCRETNGSNMQKDLLVCQIYPLKLHNIIYLLEGSVLSSEEND